ncbi:GFA family protein [Agarivorans sp. 1_MG-2023]|uniref:GFA family protein n=1 Tax=Agarivorans sp. 1_MG-2023 TaxID=3062634 RepID=UPI0026E19399|nr:GFA family protein [Agarivorans sp. 1_MG-2023]MDO6763072.1 GFA family protein [Agarivorans sp. 1_MG-2023]
MYQGSCLCGAIQVEISGGINSIIHCHCSLCRKNSGTAFATNGFVATKGFKVLKGVEGFGHYQTSPGKVRHFCKVCASPIYSSNQADPSRLRIRLGMLDSAIVERPISHNFVSSKANWEDLDADLIRNDAYEDSRS